LFFVSRRRAMQSRNRPQSNVLQHPLQLRQTTGAGGGE
jgi:hypothetical protein